jgi:hypothetical protein
VKERKENIQKPRFLFVGEKRSELAKKNGYTWQNVPDMSGHCSRKLFVALRNIGIEPREHDFVNAWDDNGNTQEIIPSGRIVIAMGEKVQKELFARGISFVPIVHPAARGIWCRQEEYNEMVKKSLESIDTRKQTA